MLKACPLSYCYKIFDVHSLIFINAKVANTSQCVCKKNHHTCREQILINRRFKIQSICRHLESTYRQYLENDLNEQPVSTNDLIIVVDLYDSNLSAVQFNY